MNLKGTGKATNLLRGSINSLKTLTISAYAIAVKHGYEGTEEEWLRSLSGGEVDDTLSIMGVAADAKATGKAIEALRNQISQQRRIVDITLEAKNWTQVTGHNNCYVQPMMIQGLTKNSQVNLNPSLTQILVFYEKNLTFLTETVGSAVNIYAIGQKPENNYTIQAEILEVTRNE